MNKKYKNIKFTNEDIVLINEVINELGFNGSNNHSDILDSLSLDDVLIKKPSENIFAVLKKYKLFKPFTNLTDEGKKKLIYKAHLLWWCYKN